ncbi:unnamed protein product [Polarella glacialis]|uniref:Uncharacterized protein n=1 Tax=Polarella glacialis TaxID=89957 RepID=A0A813G1D8_POLGL|nr:unnamed protein product [Polarella glacialis]
MGFRVAVVASFLVFTAAAAVEASNSTGVTCEWGCYDGEDEVCHHGLNQQQCAEIYGHVNWAQKCNCGVGVYAGDPKGESANIYFSVPAFIVLFRESLEVVIVLAIIVQFLGKSRDDGLIDEAQFVKWRREVYVGACLGFLVCLCVGIGFLVLASMAFDLFEGDSEKIFQFVMMVLTCAVLSFLAINFYKMIHTKQGHERKFRKRVQETIDAGKEALMNGESSLGRKHAFFFFAFSTGLREGMESIVFLVGVVSDLKDLSSLPLPIISALVLSRLVGCCFFQGTKKMRVDWFMRGSSLLLLFVAAGFFSSSMHQLQELDVFGAWSPRRSRSWQNQQIWDATQCCNDKTNRFFVLMRALFGWQDQVTPVEVFAYMAYWVIALTSGFFLVRKAKKELAGKLEEWRRQDELEAQEKVELKDAEDPDLVKVKDAEDLDLVNDAEDPSTADQSVVVVGVFCAWCAAPCGAPCCTRR